MKDKRLIIRLKFLFSCGQSTCSALYFDKRKQPATEDEKLQVTTKIFRKLISSPSMNNKKEFKTRGTPDMSHQSKANKAMGETHIIK